MEVKVPILVISTFPSFRSWSGINTKIRSNWKAIRPPWKCPGQLRVQAIAVSEGDTVSEGTVILTLEAGAPMPRPHRQPLRLPRIARCTGCCCRNRHGLRAW